jgi:hypothetical protein
MGGLGSSVVVNRWIAMTATMAAAIRSGRMPVKK